MISKIYAFSPTFGVVTKTAAKKAIEETKGDLTKIKNLQTVIEDQNKNVPDVEINFKPYEQNSEKGLYCIIGKDAYKYLKSECAEFKVACERAKAFQTVINNKPEFEKIEQEILDNCAD